MIKLVRITNYVGETLELILTQPELSGIYIKSIEGLGPAKSDINTTELATIDGSFYNSSRTEERNIVLNLGFMLIPGVTDTIEDARHLTYRFFPNKKELKFYIETDYRKLEIYGYVENNEPDIFSNAEDCQISIICPNPNFILSDKVDTISFFGANPLFEFPFECNTTIEDEMLNNLYFQDGIKATPLQYHFLVHSIHTDLIEFGSIDKNKERTINYEGTVETGVEIHIRATGDVGDITLYSIFDRGIMKIYQDKIAEISGYKMSTGDELIISTVVGNKFAYLLRGGVYRNVLNAVDKDSNWFLIHKGENTFAFSTTEGLKNLEVTIVNQVLYEGV